jgi:hypothetical protein
VLRYLFFLSFFLSMKYTDSSFIGEPSNDGNNEVEKKSKKALEDVKLKTDEQGYPMLPSWETIKDADLLTKKLIVGKFLGEMYRTYHLFTLLFSKRLICYHQGLPAAVEKGKFPGRTCSKPKGTISLTSICPPV